MSLRLGAGSLVRHGIDDVAQARHQFLLAIQRAAPEAFARLAQEVLPLYKTLPCRKPPRFLGEVVPSPALEPDRSKAKAVCEAFKAGLADWAQAHNLNTPWMRDMGVWLLWCWREFPHWEGQVKPWLLPPPAFEVLGTPDPPRYVPASMSRDEYLALVQEYLALVEATYRGAGWQRTPAKRNPEAFQWLVLYQCAGWSILRIARDHHVARQTVADQLEATANLIGLRLRARGKGGRPRNPAS